MDIVNQLPEYYFRIRENGAMVFRIDTENRQRRIEMAQIAVVNIKKGEMKPHGDEVLSPADETAISNWISERQATLAARGQDEVASTVEHLNLTTQWANSRATDDELEELTGPLLMAMHDLRTVLVRKKSQRTD